MTSTDSTKTSMESLALPPELYWNCKIEPPSPNSSDLLLISEPIGSHWECDDSFANELTLLITDLKPGLEFPHDLLNGDDLVVELKDLKEEHWNDVKVQSPHLLLDCPIDGVVPITKVLDTFGIDTFASPNYDTAILTQLTPPHSPPQNGAQVAFQTTVNQSPSNFNNVLHQTSITHPVPPGHHSNLSPPSVQSLAFPACYDTESSGSGDSNDDIVRETLIVDEILKSRASELHDWIDENESQSSYSPPSQADSNTDDEWTQSFSSSASSSPDRRYTGGDSLQGSSSTTPKKRTRPYGRGVEDRKIRKKEQNKNAATRYRQKKKIEMEIVQEQEHELAQSHQELSATLADLTREAKYLKTLIREFYQKKK